MLNISDLTSNQLIEILNLECSGKELTNKNIGLIFEKPSTRTRLSFTCGINLLNGHAININFNELNISRNETFEDTFRAFNCYLDALIYRTTDHKNLENASIFFQKPIINALSNLSHPCQTISDFLTLKEHFGSLNLKILWMGDMNNVCYSLVEAANLIKETNLIICTPDLISNKTKWVLNDNIKIVNKIEDVELEQINCIMTDVFTSMNDEEDHEKEKELSNYIVDEKLIAKTHKNSVFMHCLPAKIGSEVSEEVLRGKKSIVWRQAYNRRIAQKKLMKFLIN